MKNIKARLKHPWTWVHGLIGAAIGGAANSLSAAVIAPETFNLGKGLAQLGQLTACSAIISAALYLKQMPLPAIKENGETEQTKKDKTNEYNGPDK